MTYDIQLRATTHNLWSLRITSKRPGVIHIRREVTYYLRPRRLWDGPQPTFADEGPYAWQPGRERIEPFDEHPRRHFPSRSVIRRAEGDLPQLRQRRGPQCGPDDPAIWVHRKRLPRSIVIGTLKNGGLDVHDGLRVVPDWGESPAMVADDKPEQTRTLSLCRGDRS